jgi:short-chain fatty acids transporter
VQPGCNIGRLAGDIRRSSKAGRVADDDQSGRDTDPRVQWDRRIEGRHGGDQRHGLRVRHHPRDQLPPRRRPGEWLEYSPIPTLFLGALGLGWLVNEFATKNATTVISGLNTYNLAFLLLGLLLHWRQRRFLIAVSQAVTASSGILIQFLLYASLAHILINAKGTAGHSLGDCLSTAFVSAASAESFPVLIGIYSGVLGIFIPSGGGRWIVEAPFVMQAAMDLRVNLGWAVQAYNAAGALPNLINPFWMVPLLGIVGFKARDLIGFTFVYFVFLGPLVLFLLWLLAGTLSIHPPIMG